MRNWFIFCMLLGLFANGIQSAVNSTWGGLYPRESSSREVKSLDGLWNFRLSPLLDPDQGFRELWFSQPLSWSGHTISMAVPSSFNDITQDKEIRDHVGWAWYDRLFFVPSRWEADKQRVMLRFGSAHYNAIVYLNGQFLTGHDGGHLPFMADITSALVYGEENLLTVAINNTLTPHTVPQGDIVFKNDTSKYPPGYFIQEYSFDFLNYAGIHRPVYIYTTPQTFIDDIVVTTEIEGTDGIINYNITYDSVATGPFNEDSVGCSIKLLAQNGSHLQSAVGCVGSIKVEYANLWWPYLMAENPGYQYTLMVAVSDAEGNLDMYPQKVGIRTVGWNSTTVTINGIPVYLTGCGKHEDSDIRGKGVDNALIVKDFSLLKWLGANSFRTSHYPYAEEIMDMADKEGIMIIDECPAVNLVNFDKELMDNHIRVMEELVRRDKNRPSVIMWSIANEPRSYQEAAKEYFSAVVNATIAVDVSRRPITAALNAQKDADHAAVSLDVLMVNRYFSWYSDTGHLEVIERQTVTEFSEWHALHNKPVMISEYGAGTIAGFHQDPAYTWTEEYQAELMMNNFKAFDTLRNQGYFFGEMIWNFADFATVMGSARVVGNRKGVFTRDRQPKLSAHILRYRYHSLSDLEIETSPISCFQTTPLKNSVFN